MVDPRVFHSVTIEMSTGFLLLAGLGVVSKVVADAYLKYFSGRVRMIEKWAKQVSRLGESASYFALGAGIVSVFASMVTGALVWPYDQLVQSEVVHNKVLVVLASQTVFVSVFIIRNRFGIRVWSARPTKWVYVLLVAAGEGLLTLQNSLGGNLAGKGSLLDDLYITWGIDINQMWIFPQSALLVVAILFFPLATFTLWRELQLRRRRPTG